MKVPSLGPSDEAPREFGTFPRGFSERTRFAWPLVPVGKLVDLNYGRGLVDGRRTAGEIPVYGTNGQCGWHSEPLVRGPGVILGRKGMGPLGVEWCDSDFWVIDTAYYVTPKKREIDLKFFYYLTKYVGLNHLKDGTSNPSLSRNTFYAQLFPLPPLIEQRAIVRALTALDEKIELNGRMNETLESMAQALFKSWFVDFDPVQAKAAGQVPPGLDPKIAALFADGFEQTELGEVPAAWQIHGLDEVADFVNGLALQKYPPTGGSRIYRPGPSSSRCQR